jgi:hypothetical protein
VPGLKVNASTPAIALNAIYIAPDKLVAVVKLTMPLDVEITAALVQ